MRIYLLDTNIASYIFSGYSSAARASLDGLGPTEHACISTITESELRFGIARRKSEHLRHALDGFLKRIPIRAWDSDAAATYGNLLAGLQKSGRNLGAFDLQIAAHAIALGATLVTRDKAFQQVNELPGLVNWATDL